MSLDVLLTNARVVDGTGAPWFRGSVGVAGGRIDHVGPETEPAVAADVVRDLDGLVVAPGFVDAHSHSDLALFSDPALEPKVRQGITTEVVGQDGLSMAPLAREKGLEWQRYLSAIVGTVDEETWTWETTAEYLDAVDRAGPTVNVATLVGHGTVRNEVMGMSDRTATTEELAEMGDLVSRALEAGAVGLSTGLEYSPHRHADTREVRRLASQLAPSGRPFVAHIRSYSRDMWEALDEFVDVGASEEVPVHLSHFKLGATKVGRRDRALALAEAARDRGVDFTADLYPYVPGNTMLLALLPAWVHVGGPDALLDRLRDPGERARIERDIATNTGSWNFGWTDLVVSHVGSEANERYLGRTLADVAAAEDVSPVEAMCDLLVEEDLEVAMVALNDAEGATEDLRTVITDERVALGTDGIFAKRPHPRLHGTYPRMLGRYVRELNLLSLEETVRKMTSLPARIYNFERKGVLRPGMDADLVVFDPLTVGSRATVEDPADRPTGVVDVLVDGTFVVRDEELTEERPGAALRA
jgi:N-acyl-D-amino-acid deacylase